MCQFCRLTPKNWLPTANNSFYFKLPYENYRPPSTRRFWGLDQIMAKIPIERPFYPNDTDLTSRTRKNITKYKLGTLCLIFQRISEKYSLSRDFFPIPYTERQYHQVRTSQRFWYSSVSCQEELPFWRLLKDMKREDWEKKPRDKYQSSSHAAFSGLHHINSPSKILHFLSR